MMTDLLIAAGLVATSGGLTLLFCLWPAISSPGRVRRYPASAGEPYMPEPKRRDDFTLGA